MKTRLALLGLMIGMSTGIGCGGPWITDGETAYYNPGFLMDTRAAGKVKTPRGLEMEGNVTRKGDSETVKAIGDAVAKVIGESVEKAIQSQLGPGLNAVPRIGDPAKPLAP